MITSEFMIALLLITLTNGFYYPSAPTKWTLQLAKIPEINNWSVSNAGEVKGIIKYHPVLDDGDIITTSKLVNTDLCAEGSIVSTQSGSKYKLQKPSSQQLKLLTRQNEVTANKDPIKAGTYRGVVLSGSTVGNGKYVLAKNSFRSTSGKSTIYTAFQVGSDGLPTGPRLAVKLSPNTDALKREYNNYLKIKRGLFNGRFVSCIDFYPVIPEKQFEKQSALVIDGGVKNLKQFLDQRWGQGLSGRAMRDVAATAGQCIQAMHSSKLVWTDLKTENFVIMEEEDGNSALNSVKGIDLESARPYGRNPVDYSPEACPPEFADAFVSGYGADFVLKPSYDMWSLGMMLYELSTGMPYFGTKSSLAITKILRTPGFTVNVSKVKDKKLRDLIEQCLSIDPDKRPDINQYLLHPFFTTTGIGPFSF